MQCATTILSKQDKVLHEYTLTQEEIKKAVKAFVGLPLSCPPQNCEVEIYVVNGELMGKVMHVHKRGKK